ncbi:hypothetical protein [Segatella copri]|uniref:hypothetical protein n=1 Tax=Segatella copri TaxID=165179 RepID=UPI003F8CDE4D
MDAKLDPKDTALLVHIDHSKPIEIKDFIATLNAVGSLYSSYVKNNADCKKMANAKLYVEKIEKGCIDVYLCELASCAMIPFMENVNTILDFAKMLKDVVSYYISGQGSEPKFSLSEMKACKDLFSVSANDRGSTTSIGAISKTINGNVYNNCTFNYNDSNSAQNQIARKEAELSVPTENGEDIRKNQLMTIHQMVGDMALDKGNKAVIDAISKRKIGLLFDNDEIKNQVLHMDGNPTKKAFYVDVSLMYANERLAAYRVLKLHDIIDLEED